jgi:uncharacterized spore protein YtfJ
MDFADIVRKIGETVSASATVRSVYGEPVISGQRTIVPVASIKFAFGGGGGSDREGTNPGGGGGGGRVSAQPCGLVEVTPEGARYVDFHERQKVAAAIAIGFVVGVAVGLLSRRRRASL